MNFGPAERNVAGNLRSLRRHHDWTQADLAELMSQKGFAWWRTTVAKIETGARRVNVDELVSLTCVFRVPAQRFLCPPDSSSGGRGACPTQR